MITSGAVHVFYLFDVAQSVDLGKIRAMFGPTAATARLQDKSPGPTRIEYAQPPVVVDGDLFELETVDGFRTRVKFFDYGVVSLLLSRPFSGSWAEFIRVGQELIESDPLEAKATEMCRRIVRRAGPAFAGERPTLLNEDYLVFVVSAEDHPTSAVHVLEEHGDDLAQLLRGERQTLSRQEKDEVLRHRLSYLADDLVVPAWNAAFVLDTEPGAAATLEILELANSQLLEFRYHDDLLEVEISRAHNVLQRQSRWTDLFSARRSARAARGLQSIVIDVNELTDQVENAVKLVGDLYSARLFSLATARVGLDAWKKSVDDKLDTLDDIYQFAVQQTGMAQANLLELVIALILIIELGLFFAGIMK